MNDKPRVVARFSGVQIEDARETVKVRFTTPPARGVRAHLVDAGFKQGEPNTFIRLANPQAIFDAQEILRSYYTETN